MGILSYKGSQFYMDQEPFQIRSGAIHYFRVVPEYWEDRLKKLKACGMNTVETYICWNLHEPKEGQYNFSGILDLEKYIEIAEKLGLYVILRPGPYICAEWEFGGLPWWLLTYKGMRIRCYEPLFLEKVSRYFKELLGRIRPHLSTNGGNVIAVQIENEYGSYGDDKKYLRAIEQILLENEMDCLLFTSDGPGYFMLNGGSLPDRLATVNFGSNPKDNFALLRKFREDQPVMCCEYWNGWFDHWYEEHHTRESGDVADVYRQMLEEKASVSFYMFHGGTNFNFWNGANFDEGKGIAPTVTSYDYNCAVTESGDLTKKYFDIRKVNEEFFGSIEELGVSDLPKKAYGNVLLTEKAGMFENIEQISNPVESSYTMSMEELGQAFGFVAYKTILTGPFETMNLEIAGLRDRAICYINGEQKGIIDHMGHRKDAIPVGLKAGESAELLVLVENLGRVNYGSRIWEEKGILKGIKIGPMFHYGYTMYPLPCDNIEKLNYIPLEEKDQGKLVHEPMFLKGKIYIEEKADTFVKLEGFTKGNVWINGFNLGRFWNEAGPQRTLYLPAPLLKSGENEFVILELEEFKKPFIQLVEKEELG